MQSRFISGAAGSGNNRRNIKPGSSCCATVLSGALCCWRSSNRTARLAVCLSRVCWVGLDHLFNLTPGLSPSMNSMPARSKPLCLSEIKSERIDGVNRQELVSAECVQPPERPVGLAHLSSGIDACVRRCNSACRSGAGDADVWDRPSGSIPAPPPSEAKSAALMDAASGRT